MRCAPMVILSLFSLVLIGQGANAERPPQKREEATHVLVGVIKQIDTKESKFGNDGVQTDYTAELTIDEVKKGTGPKAGETVKISWFHVTMRPSQAMPGAYGHEYKVKKGDRVTVYLIKGGNTYDVIYNSEGMELVKK